MEETDDERQLFVPLGNRIQGKADWSIIAVEPVLLLQIYAGGLPFASELGFSPAKGCFGAPAHSATQGHDGLTFPF
jgi:hypothetical protein